MWLRYSKVTDLMSSYRYVQGNNTLPHYQEYETIPQIRTDKHEVDSHFINSNQILKKKYLFIHIERNTRYIQPKKFQSKILHN